jgi:hypothetical protein
MQKSFNFSHKLGHLRPRAASRGRLLPDPSQRQQRVTLLPGPELQHQTLRGLLKVTVRL